MSEYTSFKLAACLRPMKKTVLNTTLFACMALLVFAMGSCKEDTISTDPNDFLAFSTDTLQFDTVFTSVGSVTRDFLIYNNADQPVVISNIRIAGGESSRFRMNVDGIPGSDQDGIEVPANDSVWVFVEVTIDPNSDFLPYVVEDSIIFMTNGNTQNVLLVAWGQNANFLSGQRICDEVWVDDLPYVIYNYIQVDSNCTLTILEGCRVHFHANSGILVDGTLLVEGQADSMVVFEGDRLEGFFNDQPGQWDGIYLLRGSIGNSFENCVIKNSVDGIAAGFTKSPNLSDFNASNMPEATLNNVTIHDITGNGIIALLAKIDATNVQIFNVGSYNAALLMGGDYRFNHSTLANYGSFFLNHQTPVIGISNFFNFGQDENGADVIIESDLVKAEFINSIIEGNIIEGKELSLADFENTASFNHQFTNCMIRTERELTSFNNTNCIINQDPIFTSRSNNDYTLFEGSPAIDAGISSASILDILNNPRPFSGTLPDMGAFESGYE
ncbi:MAG: hypothetical protein ACI959_001073 [Limisphaerales bacterium]|jgi:hypothetical protein